MADDEQDPKEYRWETGYEKTWLVLWVQDLVSLSYSESDLHFMLVVGRLLKKTRMVLWKVWWRSSPRKRPASHWPLAAGQSDSA